jgi:hypothetical protein
MEAGMLINGLLLRFEAIGDDCEFGLMQIYFGTYPVSLLRFAGFEVLLSK